MIIEDAGQSTTKESRWQAILEAALACFSSKGFTEITMEDIRKLSGVSTGSIYHHFENKEMLARALYLEGRSSLNSALFASLPITMKETCSLIHFWDRNLPTEPIPSWQ